MIYLFNELFLKAILFVEAIACASSTHGLVRNLYHGWRLLVLTRNTAFSIKVISYAFRLPHKLFFLRWVHVFVTNNISRLSWKKYSYMVFITLLLDFAIIMNFPNKPFQKNISWVLNKSNFKTNINSVIKLLRRLKYKIETVSF